MQNQVLRRSPLTAAIATPAGVMFLGHLLWLDPPTATVHLEHAMVRAAADLDGSAAAAAESRVSRAAGYTVAAPAAQLRRAVGNHRHVDEGEAAPERADRCLDADHRRTPFGGPGQGEVAAFP
jgi:hypothetical protein